MGVSKGGQLGTIMRPRGSLVCGPRDRKEEGRFGKTDCLEFEGGWRQGEEILRD